MNNFSIRGKERFAWILSIACFFALIYFLPEKEQKIGCLGYSAGAMSALLLFSRKNQVNSVEDNSSNSN